jgi:hypothetical protein
MFGTTKYIIAKSLLFIGVLSILALSIKLYSASALRVEESYSNGFYPWIVATLRLLFGWLPFSIGDILYGLFGIWLLWKLVKLVKIVVKRKVAKDGFIRGTLKTTIIFLLLYVFFNGLWGINYNRKGIAYQLGLKMEKYSLDDLKNINSILLNKVNAAKQSLVNSKAVYPSSKQLFAQVKANYEAINSSYPFLQYSHQSLKPSLWLLQPFYRRGAGKYNSAKIFTTLYCQPRSGAPTGICQRNGSQLCGLPCCQCIGRYIVSIFSLSRPIYL